jgi:23S rRNA maturation-related 3'-5' exoribonuclease YhaM
VYNVYLKNKQQQQQQIDRAKTDLNRTPLSQSEIQNQKMKILFKLQKYKKKKSEIMFNI